MKELLVSHVFFSRVSLASNVESPFHPIKVYHLFRDLKWDRDVRVLRQQCGFFKRIYPPELTGLAVKYYGKHEKLKPCCRYSGRGSYSLFCRLVSSKKAHQPQNKSTARKHTDQLVGMNVPILFQQSYQQIANSPKFNRTSNACRAQTSSPESGKRSNRRLTKMLSPDQDGTLCYSIIIFQ